MLMTKEHRPSVRTMRGWAISVLQEAGAIRECEEHGWMQDRADPHARERAFAAARQDRPPSVPLDQAFAEIRDVLDSIGDSCPESVHRTAARLRLAILAAEEANSMEQRRLQLPASTPRVPAGRGNGLFHRQSLDFWQCLNLVPTKVNVFVLAFVLREADTRPITARHRGIHR